MSRVPTPRSNGQMVLVTGAAGKIGKYVVTQLIEDGYTVVALTSKLSLAIGPESTRAVVWRHHNWLESIDFSEHVRNCDAVIHLGAEIWRMDRMARVNVDATDALARAAENEGVRSFVYASSIGVYGSSYARVVYEDAPLLTPGRDIRSEYRANESLRAYGRSKVAAENRITAACQRTRFAIARPTVVVDIDDLLAATRFSQFVKSVGAKRLTHFIYVADVAAALIWLMRRNLSDDMKTRGDAFNISDEAGSDARFSDFYRRIENLSGIQGIAEKVTCPTIVYNAFDMLKNGSFSRRLPLGMTEFSGSRLNALGYEHKYGIDFAEKLAAARLKTTSFAPG
jgi:nucleoside-diphosphate-sugar epimerase